MRPGLTWQGLLYLQNFVKSGGVFLAATNSTDIAINYGLTRGISVNPTPPSTTTNGSLLRTRLVDAGSPIAYGMRDSLAVFTDNGASYTVSGGGGGRGGRGGGGGGGGGGAAGGGGRGGAALPNRATGTGRADDVDVVQGRPPLIPTYVQRDTADNTGGGRGGRGGGGGAMPADQQPRTILRFAEQPELLVSGLLNGGEDIAGRANLVHVPMERGHVVLFSFNPMYRGGTIGSYPFVLNTILHFDNLGAGRAP
jgi:hypothetical protein